MSVDYERQLKDNEAAKQGELQKINESYGKTASDYQTEVDKQQQQLEDYQEEQSRLQQEQTDFAIDKIKQQQEQAEKDYTKEQQAAYGDYKRQTDPYGVNAEQMASLGLSRSGYSESSNVAMYTAYQNRVAAARASFEQAKQTFDNAIREAKLTNDVNLAKIAAETLEKSLALSMESVVYLGNLELEKAAKVSSIEQTYYNRAQNIWDAQQAEILAAKQGSMGVGDGTGDYIITGGEGDTRLTGNDDFTAVESFFGDGVSEDAVAQMIVDGIITVETVNGVNVYKVADEEKARAYMAERLGSADSGNGQDQGAGNSQPQEQPKYNYSDERVNEYFRQKDAVEALQKEYNDALNDLNLIRDQFANPAVDHEGVEAAFNAQREYVNKLSKQLRTAYNKLENMLKPTESSVYMSRDSECKKAKEALETAEYELREMQQMPVSAEALSSAEEKVRNAKKAFDVAYAKLMSVDRYTISSGTAGTTHNVNFGNSSNQMSLR